MAENDNLRGGIRILHKQGFPKKYMQLITSVLVAGVLVLFGGWVLRLGHYRMSKGVDGGAFG